MYKTLFKILCSAILCNVYTVFASSENERIAALLINAKFPKNAIEVTCLTKYNGHAEKLKSIAPASVLMIGPVSLVYRVHALFISLHRYPFKQKDSASENEQIAALLIDANPSKDMLEVIPIQTAVDKIPQRYQRTILLPVKQHSTEFWSASPCYLRPSYPNSKLAMRCASFFHASQFFRDIYNKVGVDYQLEFTRKVFACMEAWGNLDWYSKSGNSVRFHKKTRVKIANVSVGLKYVYKISNQFDIYIGLGPSLGKIFLKNKINKSDQKLSKYALGAVAKTGLRTYLRYNLILDLFFDYIYQPVHFESHVNIGGAKIGLGLGKAF